MGRCQIVLLFVLVKRVMNLPDEEFQCVFEEDGCEIAAEVLEDIFANNEKVDLIMILSGDELWTGDEIVLISVIQT